MADFEIINFGVPWEPLTGPVYLKQKHGNPGLATK